MIEGYAVLYNVRSAYGLKGLNCCEMILPGAFKDSVLRGRTAKGKRIKAVLNHNNAIVLGRIGRGLYLEDRDDGVYFRLAIPMLPGIRGMSFSFSDPKWAREGGLYILHHADLKSISILTNQSPAYPATLKTIREDTSNVEEIEMPKT